MDRFYLENAALYRKLVDSLDTTVPAPHFSRQKAAPPKEDVAREQSNPDMVLGARIRPMLDDDLAAGFPRAAYPRAVRQGQTPESQTVDLHDLYNHPRGRPVLKVCEKQLSSG